jgi:arylsulfatase A-like enzyme
VLFATYALLEWIVLFSKLPVTWSGSLALAVLLSLGVYAAVGAVVGLAALLAAFLLFSLSGRRWSAAATPAGVRAITLGFSVLPYWILVVARRSPAGVLAPVSIVLFAVTTAAAVVLVLVLLRLARRSRPAALAIVILAVVLIVPVYWPVAGTGVERIEGAIDLGAVRIDEGRPLPDGPNVLLIMLDTARVDCIDCYGAEFGLTPAIDALASESVLFEACVTPEPLTRPTTATLFTGLYPMTHGVDTNTKVLPEDVVTLAETLRGAGYVTGGFPAAEVLSGFYGTDQGFDTYAEPVEPSGGLHHALALSQLAAALTGRSGTSVELPADVMTARASSWIASNRARPFFAYVHYFDPHWPYEPPGVHDLAAKAGLADVQVPYDDPQARFHPDFDMPESFLQREWLRYHGEMQFMDVHVGRLIDELGRLGLDEDTIVVLVSDHGEGFEHQFYFAHGNRLYDQLVSVALMIRHPDASPSRIGRQVRLIDVCPTVLALCGVPAASEMQGVDLSDVVLSSRTHADDLPAFCQTDFENTKPLSSRISVGLRLPPWKYIDSREIGLEELYNLETDPGETENLADALPDVRREMARLVDEWVAATERRQVTPAELIPERLEALRALGYVR